MKSVLLMFMVAAINWQVQGQMVGPNYFLQGNFVQVGQAQNGSFGPGPAPAGYNPPTGTSLAMVYDYGFDGFTVGTPGAYGDYTVLGTPFEGWGIEVNGVRSDAFFTTGAGTGFWNAPGGTLIGSNVPGGSSSTAIWQGTAGPGGALSIRQVTTLGPTDRWVTVTTYFTNTGAVPLPGVFYERTCDPDNERTITGNWATNNTITWQNDVDNRVLVGATGPATPVYLALGTKDPRAVAFIYADWPQPQDPTLTLSAIHSQTLANGHGLYVFGGSTQNQDIAIGLVYDLGTLNPGECTQISYSYIFDNAASLDLIYPTPVTPLVGTAGVVTGADPLCQGDVSIYTNSGGSPGAWSCSGPASVATIDPSTGALTAVSGGTVTITFTPFASCVPPSTKTVTIIPELIPGSIVGDFALCVGETSGLSFTGSTGGVWTSLDPSTAIIDPVTGIVGAVAPGTAVISYIRTSPPCPPVSATVVVTISVTPSFSPSASFYPTPCTGSDLYLTSGVVSGCSGCTYSWTGPGGFTSTDAHPVISGVTVATTGNYTLVVTNHPSGCSHTREVYAEVLPVPDAGVISPIVLCMLSSQEIFLTGATGVGTFDFDPPTIVASTSGMYVNGLYPGTAVIRHTYTNACGTDYSYGTVTVKPLPVAYLTYTGCNPVCPGTPLTFTIHGTAGTIVGYDGSFTGLTYVTMPAGTGMTTVNVTVPATIPSTSIHLVNVSDPPLPKPPCSTKLNEKIVVKVLKPYGEIDRQVRPVCQGGCATLHIVGSPDALIYINSVPASGPDIAVNTDMWGNGYVVVCPTVTTTYEVTKVDAYCCITPISGPTVTLVVLPYPTVTMTSNSPVCEGGSLVLTATCIDCDGYYEWNGPMVGPAISSLVDNTYTITPVSMADEGLYCVTTSNGRCFANGCTDVDILEAPYATFLSDALICEGDTDPVGVTIKGTAGTTVTYSISTGGTASVTLPGTPGTTVVHTFTVTPPATTTILTITGISHPSGCPPVVSPAYPTSTITVVPNPGLDCIFEYNATTGAIDIVGYATGFLVTYQPYDALGFPIGGPLTTTASSILPSAPDVPPGTSYVSLISVTMYGCEWETVDCLGAFPVPTSRPGSTGSEWMPGGKLSVNPNPNNGTFTLSGYADGLKSGANATVEMADVLGKKIAVYQVTVRNGYVSQKIGIDASVANGIYFLKVKNENTSYVLRVALDR